MERYTRQLRRRYSAILSKYKNNNNFVSVESIVGKDLLSYNGSLTGGHGCGMIYAVGAAAERPDHEPRLVRISYRPDNTWGERGSVKID